MNMLTRPNFVPLFDGVTEQVKLPTGENPETAFKLWKAKITATPRYCPKHHKTKLVLSQQGTGIWPGSAGHRRWETRPKPESGEFSFRANFQCPACLVVHTLCPLEFHESCFATFDTSTAERAAMLARAREFSEQVHQHRCGFALFVGGPGTGKSLLGCNIIHDFSDINALYVRQGTLTTALRATYGQRVKEYDGNGELVERPHPLEVSQRVPLLVLDEIGCTALANDERLLLDELLKHRYENRKPTILISNLPLDQFKDFVGDALFDRIRHATGNGKFILQFSGGSFRRTAGETYLGVNGQK